MKTKICFLKNDTSGGGIERVVTIIASEISIRRKDIEVHIIDLNNKDNKKYYYIDEKIKYHSLSKARQNKYSIFGYNYKLYRYLANNKIDILVTSQPMLGLYSLLPTKLTKTKNIIWEHGNYFQKQGSKYIDFIRQYELKNSDYYIVLNKRDQRNFMNSFDVECPLQHIYNPIIPNNIKNSYNLESKLIISVGHIKYIKGFDMLIEVAKIVFRKHPSWKWNIYGDGPDLNKIKESIISCRLEHNLILCGRAIDIQKEYELAAIYVMTSRMEGLPMALLEAKANRLPIISFDIETGPDEIIIDSVNGYLIEPYNIELMALKICNLIEDAELRVNFSINSKKEIEKFSIDYIIQSWFEVFNKVLN